MHQALDLYTLYTLPPQKRMLGKKPEKSFVIAVMPTYTVLNVAADIKLTIDSSQFPNISELGV